MLTIKYEVLVVTISLKESMYVRGICARTMTIMSDTPSRTFTTTTVILECGCFHILER